MKNTTEDRRSFLQKLVGAGITATGILSLRSSASIIPSHKTIEILRDNRKVYSPNDQIQIGLIGAGNMGNSDLDTALTVAGVKVISVCDLYTGRLNAASLKYPGISTTKEYEDLIARKDIDAVIIATPDHHHKHISIDAMKAGKHVYCEKPMVHSISEGHELVEAQKQYQRIFQVGSQGLSSVGNNKAKELLESGVIGELNYAEGFWARNSPLGAWQYPIPADASEKNVDWKRFLGDNPVIPFDPVRFFRWRNYRDYGTGVCGDLFVHLFSSLHYIANSKGPTKIVATGGLRYWKDGREVPDIMIGMFDYPKTIEHPAFNLSLRCNFVDGTSGNTYLKLVGSKGSMDIGWDEVTLKLNQSSKPMDAFDKNVGSAGTQKINDSLMNESGDRVFKAEDGYLGAHHYHHQNFYDSIRSGIQKVEDSTFGFRAAAPALLCNQSYEENKILNWDPINLKPVNHKS